MYDEIAGLYHLVYEDWNAAIEQQAAALDDAIVGLIGQRPHSLLDVSCGIGTQTLGLAARNYKVTASDLSRHSVSRARREALNRGLDVDFSVADMRECADDQIGAFDVVLSADNSIPHLQSVAEVAGAIQGFFRRLRPGGVTLVGVRDYKKESDRTSPQMRPYGFRHHGGHRYFVFQTRDYFDEGYDVALYFVREATPNLPSKVSAGVSRYYFIGVDQLMELFTEAGFEDVRRLDSVMFQPIVVGRRPGR